MIRTSCATACAALLGWHLALGVLPDRHRGVPSVDRGNRQRVEAFVHARGATDEVIVGSSMADRLDEIVLGPGIAKLTFVGGSPLTGLEIVRRSERVPPVIWIETNMVIRPPERTLIDHASSPWRTALRDDTDLFKEAGRPSAYALDGLQRAFGKASRAIPWLAGASTGGAASDPDFRARVMEGNRDFLRQAPDPTHLREQLEALAFDAAELRERGCRIVFFEMPVDPTLSKLPHPVVVRTALRDRFPASHWGWFDPGPAEAWRTSDGIHLEPADATRFAVLLRGFADSAGK